jgi:hypothetical protein
MVYVPVGRAFAVRMGVVRGSKVRAWWFNPRNAEVREIGTFDSAGERSILPPAPGEMLDWILVLDDASKHYPEPGRTTR